MRMRSSLRHSFNDSLPHFPNYRCNHTHHEHRQTEAAIPKKFLKTGMFHAARHLAMTVTTKTQILVLSHFLFCHIYRCSAKIMRSQPPSLFGSPAAASLHQWRYTPPPTSSSAVRTSKRKCKSLSHLFPLPSFPIANAPPMDIVDDDRFDPYPTSSKRRAVSPSVSFLRENHTSLSPIYIPRPGSSSRGPIPVPMTSSATGSVASSP